MEEGHLSAIHEAEGRRGGGGETLPMRSLRRTGLVVLWLGVSLIARVHAQTPAPRGLDAPETIEEQKSAFSLRMAAGFSGAPDRIRAERWFPVTVDCRNRTDKNVEATVTLVWFQNGAEATDLSYIRRISLPAHSRKRLRLVVLDKRECSVLVGRLDSDGAVLASQSIALFREFDDRSAVLVVTSRTGDFSFLLPPQNSEKVDPMPAVVQRDVWEESPDRLPEEWAAYEGCDAVVLDNVSLMGLTAAQRGALRDYCLVGGRLVAMYGSGARGFMNEARDLAALMPVALDGTTRSIDARIFAARFGGEIRSEGIDRADSRPPPSPADSEPPVWEGLVRLLVANGKSRSGATVFLESGGTPLVAWQDRGLGRAVFCAFSLGEAPFRRWPEKAELFDEVLGWGRLGVLTPTSPAPGTVERPYVPPTFAHTRNTAAIWAQMAEVTNRDAVIKPLAWEMAGLFLLAYVLAVGPLTFLVFRLFRRTEFAWLTMPFTIAGFAVAVQYLDRGVGTRTVSAQTYTLIEAASGSPSGRATSMISLYTPARGEYAISFGGGSVYPSPVPGAQLGRGLTRRPFTIDQTSGPPRLVDFEMLPRSSRVLRTEQPIRMDKGVTVDLETHETGSRSTLGVSGRVVNGTRWPLFDLVLLLDGKIVAQADSLAAGAMLQVDREVERVDSVGWGPSADTVPGSCRIFEAQPIPVLPERPGPGGLFEQIVATWLRQWIPPEGCGAVLLAAVPPQAAAGFTLEGEVMRPEGRAILYLTGGAVTNGTPVAVGEGGWDYRVRRRGRTGGGVGWRDSAGTLQVLGGEQTVEIEMRPRLARLPTGECKVTAEYIGVPDYPTSGRSSQSCHGWSWGERQWNRITARTGMRWGLTADTSPEYVGPGGVIRCRICVPFPVSGRNYYAYGGDVGLDVSLHPRALFRWK